MATGTTAQQIIEVVTPAAGESVTEGTILEWHVKVGDFIKADDTIVEISTDKVDLELPSPASGTVTEILADEGETVGVGQVIARLAVGDEGSNSGSAHQALTSRDEGNDPSAHVRIGRKLQAHVAGRRECLRGQADDDQRDHRGGDRRDVR